MRSFFGRIRHLVSPNQATLHAYRGMGRRRFPGGDNLGSYPPVHEHARSKHIDVHLTQILGANAPPGVGR